LEFIFFAPLLWSQPLPPFPNIESEESKYLSTYLKSENPTLSQTKKALNILEQSQVIYLHYEKNAPLVSENSRDEHIKIARSLQAYTTPISLHHEGKIYPQISATFSKFFHGKQQSAKEWLEEIKIPLKAGYNLTEIGVILTPSAEIKEKTFLKCQEVAKNIFSKLKKLKLEFSQLNLFSENNFSVGNWGNNEWPKYPYVMYQYGVKSTEKKGPIETTVDDWCIITFSIHPVTGSPRATFIPSRLYPRQGIEISWKVNSDNEDFNKVVTQIIKEALQPLELLETKFENKK
jgi:hypothetical protein